MLAPLTLVLEQPAAIYQLPGMILQPSLFFLVIVEDPQWVKLRLSTSIHTMMFQFSTPQKEFFKFI